MIILPLRKLAEIGKKCILTWFCEEIISYGIFQLGNERMSRSSLWQSHALHCFVEKGKKIRWLKHSILF